MSFAPKIVRGNKKVKCTIREAATLAGVRPSTIRYYDSMGLLPYTLREEGGARIFDDLDLNWIQLLGYLKSAGMSIEVMKKYVDDYVKGDCTLTSRRNLVYNQREILKKKLDELSEAMNMINFKCWLYDTASEHGSFVAAREMPRDQIPPDILETIDKMNGFLPYALKERYAEAVKKSLASNSSTDE